MRPAAIPSQPAELFDHEAPQGAYVHLPEDIYRQHAYTSQSDLKHRTGLHMMHERQNPKPQSESMLTGQALHCIVLEPETYLSRFAVLPQIDRRTKAGKQAYADFMVQSEGKKVLKWEQSFLVDALAKSINDSPVCSKILSGEGEFELSVFAEVDGIGRKCRLDYLTETGVIIDIKTTQNAEFNDFRKSVYNFGYHIQAAYYLDTCKAAGLNADAFCIIAVEKDAPHCLCFYEINEAAIEKGREQYEQKLEILAPQIKSGDFKGYSADIVEMDLPSWAW